MVARRPLTEQEMADVWAAADDFPEAELAVLVLDLLRETGGRRQSAADLRLDDACWSASAVWLHTKGDENHLRVVSQDLLERIAVRAIDVARSLTNATAGSPARPHDLRFAETMASR